MSSHAMSCQRPPERVLLDLAGSAMSVVVTPSPQRQAAGCARNREVCPWFGSRWGEVGLSTLGTHLEVVFAPTLSFLFIYRRIRTVLFLLSRYEFGRVGTRWTGLRGAWKRGVLGEGAWKHGPGRLFFGAGGCWIKLLFLFCYGLEFLSGILCWVLAS